MRRLLPIIIPLLLLGCARRELIRPPRRSEIAEQVLRSLEEQAASLRTLQAFGTLTGTEAGRGYWANFVLLYQNPGRFRLDLTGPFGMALMTMVSDGKTVEAYYPETGELLEGELGLFLPVRLEGAEVEKLVLGTIEAPHGIEAALVYSEGGSYILESPDQTWQMDVDERDMRLRRYRKQSDGGSALEVKWGQYRSVDGFLRPFQVEISQPEDGKRLKIDCNRQVLNEDLKDEAFELSVPVKN